MAQASTIQPRSYAIVLPWLLKLRWGGVVCQILLIVAVSIFLEIRLPVIIVSGIITFQALSNLFLAHLNDTGYERPNTAVIIIMFLDVSLLSLLIHYTGGPMNPFTFLYLVHIVVGSLVMRPKWSWTLAAFTISSYAVLFFIPANLSAASGQPQPLCHVLPSAAAITPAMQLHLRGMWLAFAITSIFIVFFVSKIQAAMDNYQQTITRLQRAKNNNEKLASLATLAAGAAHELSTPLAAIAVAAGEMQHSLRQESQQDDHDRLRTAESALKLELLDDAIFIRQQIDSCQDILSQMSSDAGQPMGEPPCRFNLASFLEEIIQAYTHEALTLVHGDQNIMAELPPQTFKRVIRSLINNSLAACPDNEPITLSYDVNDTHISITVNDQGCGMDDETLGRATEPFFTTKDPGKGLGLGLFLAKTVARRYGGDMKIKSTGKGTRTVWSFARKQQ
jgi:two-component system sensor histidine kinase RegB